MQAIIDEVRWELDTHGHSGVKIFLSGGVTRQDVILFRHCVDAFGIGGAIANAPVIDFGMDIVEINGKPRAKRGKRSGIKQVYLMPDGRHQVLPAIHPVPAGGSPLIERCIDKGRIVCKTGMHEARARVLDQISYYPVD